MKTKSLLLFSLLFLAGMPGKSQITFEHSFNYSGLFTQLPTSGSKFYLMDWEAEQCRLYNTDYSLYKTVQLSLPNNYYMYDIKHVSQHLFNSDDMVEMAVISRKYIATSTSYYYQYVTDIVNENGQVLLSVSGSSWIEIFTSSDNQTRMMLYVYDYSSFPYDVETRIYSVPGTLSGTTPLEPDNQFTVKAFPNPASAGLTLRFDQPLISPGTIVIRDIRGSVVLEKDLSNQTVEEQIDLMGLSSGTYTYQLITPNLVITPTTFVVSH